MANIATIGFFDGVHLGHLSLVQQLQQHAHSLHLSTLLVTFSQHPLTLIQGHSPDLLLTHDERLRRLNQLHLDEVIELDFASVHSLTARAFMQYLHDEYQVQALLMGYDHHFGSDRLPSIEDYQQAGRQAHVEVYLASKAPQGAISSTRIRHALREGRLGEANRMLGYPYTLSGTVIHGHHIGTQLGFPTANLNLQSAISNQQSAISNQQSAICNHQSPISNQQSAITNHQSAISNQQSPILLPKHGVYAARVDNQPALVNIGHNPTFGADQPLSIEVHIPGFQGDLYDQTLSVQLLHYLREDQSFPSQEALIAQIHHDLHHLAQLL